MEEAPRVTRRIPTRALLGRADGSPPSHGHGFGTAPVFLAAISTILGDVLFVCAQKGLEIV